MYKHNRLIVAGILVLSIILVLRAESDTLRDSAWIAGESLSTTADSAKQVIIVKQNHDTIFTMNASTPAACIHDAGRALENSRARGYGIGGGPLTGVQAIDMGPIETLIDEVSPLAGREFGLNRWGTTETAVQRIDTGSYSIFNIDRDDREADKIKAHFAMIEVHGGLVWTMRPVFHIGIDVVAPFFFSANGFEPYTADFYSVNPGIRLKFVFGNPG
jgi:hypothetical protein